MRRNDDFFFAEPFEASSSPDVAESAFQSFQVRFPSHGSILGATLFVDCCFSSFGRERSARFEKCSGLETQTPLPRVSRHGRVRLLKYSLYASSSEAQPFLLKPRQFQFARRERGEPLDFEELERALASSERTKLLGGGERADIEYVLRLLREAKPECAEILWNHYALDWSYAEIRSIFGISDDLARMRIKRCLDRVRKLVEEGERV